MSLYELGYVDYQFRNNESARNYIQRALEIQEAIGDRRNLARSLQLLGFIDYQLSNYESARAYTQRALKIEEEMGDRQTQAKSLYQLGCIDYQLGKYESAREYTQRGLEIKEDMEVQTNSLRLLERIENAAIGNKVNVKPDIEVLIEDLSEDGFKRETELE
jgi:tetratricopeptide (TPR) repeat protein